MDIAVSNYNSKAALFVNSQSFENNWIGVKLEGRVSNREGIGALIRVITPERNYEAARVLGSGFLSQNSSTIHFGLGNELSSVKIEVIWPSGIVDRIDEVLVNKVYNVFENFGLERPSR